MEEEKNEVGRPTKYDKKFNKQAFKLCLLGSTDKQLSDFFEVSESTLNLWKIEHPKFSESLRKGRDEADAKVAHSLYHRALGYKHADVHISSYEGIVEKTPITKHYPPDTAAAKLWLHNRRPKDWQEKQKIEHSGEILNSTPDTSMLSDEELKAMRDIQKKMQSNKNGD